MIETLLIVLIVLMSLTLLGLAWGTIGLLVVAKHILPAIQREVNEVKAQINALNQRAAQVLDEMVPTLRGATATLKEAERAMREAAETIENLHIVSDNIRHKLEVADEIGAKVRRLPERAARLLGKLMHEGFKLGGRALSRQIEKRLTSKRPTVYDNPHASAPDRAALPISEDITTPQGVATVREDTHASPNGADSLAGATGEATLSTAAHTPSEDSAPEAECIPSGEATHTTHKEG